MDKRLGAGGWRWLGVVVASLSLALATATCGSRSGKGRVMVLGLDGMDPRAVDLFKNNLARLREQAAKRKP